MSSNPLDSILPADIRRRLSELADEENAEEAWRGLWASRLGKLFAVLVAILLLALFRVVLYR
jgi:hypothetical protein